MSCKKKKCCSKSDTSGAVFTEIPGQMIEAKDLIQGEIKIKAGGTIMGRLIKFLFKMTFRLAFCAAIAAGAVYLLNKFAPDTLDSLTDWLKEQRED